MQPFADLRRLDYVQLIDFNRTQIPVAQPPQVTTTKPSAKSEADE